MIKIARLPNPNSALADLAFSISREASVLLPTGAPSSNVRRP